MSPGDEGGPVGRPVKLLASGSAEAEKSRKRLVRVRIGGGDIDLVCKR